MKLTKRLAVACLVATALAPTMQAVDNDFGMWYSISAEKKITKIIFDKSKLSEEIDYSLFKNKDNWGDLCVLSDDERKEIKELWKELLV